MSRKALFNKAKELGLKLDCATCTTGHLIRTVDKEIYSRINLGMDASFEEQFDFFVQHAPNHTPGYENTAEENMLSRHLVPYNNKSHWLAREFAQRLYAGVALYHLSVDARMSSITEPEGLAKIKELCLLLEGRNYSQSHPTSAIETVTKLRQAKQMFLKGKLDGCFRDLARAFLAGYFGQWELTLSDEAVDLL